MSDQWKTFWQRLAVGNGWALAEIVELKGRR
jgi:hypothetical protein